MKVIISYPPLNNEKGCPTLGQNRQFQYFKDPTFIYPVVPATAATMLKQAGFEVIWNDSLAKGWNYAQFLEFIKKEQPDLVAFETKTPVVKQHWKIINDIKESTRWLSPKGAVPVIVLFGDHVTALPEESFTNSQVDFVITGGDYDFLLLNLCRCLQLRFTGYDLRITDLEPGIYYRENAQVKNTGKFQLNHDLNKAPFIDRDLTCWKDYACRNGIYKRLPGTYIMSSRDCWWGRCSFCSWPTLYPEFRSRSVENVLDEIGVLIDRYGVREVMDDSGCFPAGEWLRDFCSGMISRGYNKKIYFDCNMRFGALDPEDYKLMKKANFRLLLFGLESANQATLERINKNLKVEQITQGCYQAAKAGLFPHITIMFGYPWESYEDAFKTLRLGQWLLKKGLAYTMQATVVIPYPGSPLFGECREKGWLKSLDWNDYDMKRTVMANQMEEERLMHLVQGMYRVTFNPEFMLRKLLSLRDIDDLKYQLRGIQKVMGHIFDFRHRNERVC
jgi:radical SAM superfamily enzyme YgiQ (UPF0313 family)